MQTPSNRQLRGRWRRWLFWSWVAASVVIALYVGLAGPVSVYFAEGKPFVALASPVIMFFMVITGAVWLVLLATSRRRKN